jgi:Tol biopolymer transport system component
MTTERRLAELPDILSDLARGPYPAYIDDVFLSTGRLRQRRAWTFPEWWLPILDPTRGPVLAPRLRSPAIAFALIVIALLVAAIAVLSIGSPPRLPSPYGLARNGLVAYAAGGDIFTVDPVSGATTALVTGPKDDRAPEFSPDGTQVVFLRSRVGGGSELFVVRADGTHLTNLTPDGVTVPDDESTRNYDIAPDGRSVLFTAWVQGVSTISIAQLDGSGVRRLDVGMQVRHASFRPPDQTEILFVGWNYAGDGVYAVDPTSGVVRSIVKPLLGWDIVGAAWSPDGSRILYWRWSNQADGMTARTHVISAGGTGDRELPTPPGVVWNAVATWSNDGTRIFLVRGYSGGFDDVRPAVVPADGSSVGVEFAFNGTAERDCCSAWIFSPDDTTILGRPGGTEDRSLRLVMIDLATGETRPVSWPSTSDPTWQRTAQEP